MIHLSSSSSFKMIGLCGELWEAAGEAAVLVLITSTFSIDLHVFLCTFQSSFWCSFEQYFDDLQRVQRRCVLFRQSGYAQDTFAKATSSWSSLVELWEEGRGGFIGDKVGVGTVQSF